ncbi:MAG: hypothetical protein AAF916_04095 [Planctomycetota bacterium]
MKLFIALILTVGQVALAQPATQPATQPADFADRWSLRTVNVEPIVDLPAEDNPLPLYWAGNPRALPVPDGIPVRGHILMLASHVFGLWPADVVDGVKVSETYFDHDLEAHLTKVRDQLTKPDAKPFFAGDAVREAHAIMIDFEKLGISWARTGKETKAIAIRQIRERNPDAVRYMTDEEVEDLAKKEWERRANEVFVKTANLIREVIPGTEVGFYNLTIERRLWRDDWDLNAPLAIAWRKENEVAMPTVMASDVLFPAVYHFYKAQDISSDGMGYVMLNVGGARTLADKANALDGGDRQVISVAWGLYHDSNKDWKYQPISEEDAHAAVFGAFHAGADGLAFWDNARGWREHRGVPLTRFRSEVWPLYTEVFADPYAELLALVRGNPELAD